MTAFAAHTLRLTSSHRVVRRGAPKAKRTPPAV